MISTIDDEIVAFLVHLDDILGIRDSLPIAWNGLDLLLLLVEDDGISWVLNRIVSLCHAYDACVSTSMHISMIVLSCDSQIR